jgi:hypothetical protein
MSARAGKPGSKDTARNAKHVSLAWHRPIARRVVKPICMLPSVLDGSAAILNPSSAGPSTGSAVAGAAAMTAAI